MSETGGQTTLDRDAVTGAVRRLERALGGFAALTLLVTMLITLVDVLGRYFFSAPLPAGHELTELLVGVVVYTAIPLITIRNQQITITLFSARWPEWLRQLLLTIVPLFSAVVMGLLAWRLIVQASKLAEFGSATIYLQWSIYPFVYFMGIMAVLSTLIYLILAIFRMKLSGGDADVGVSAV
ncbi:MAG: TRAP transporter small permease [Defluviicoccus sp.]|nr:TRAP transporter small permease [Defluviicoccus sp.]MDE0382902.1 TRAP transporter small permease [Defluviicoccus sp.]